MKFHVCSEFFINEDNKETIWGASYEESTEHHVISQEQLTQMSKLQQTTTYACYNVKNETVATDLTMDLTCGVEMSTLNMTKKQDRTNTPITGSKSKVNDESRNSIQNTSILRPKLQLFQPLYKETASCTTSQVVDMSFDESVSNKMKNWEADVLADNSQVLDSKSVFSILRAAPSKSKNSTGNQQIPQVR